MAGIPVLARDGVVYLPTGDIEDGADGKAYLRAIRTDCTEAWAYRLPGGPGLTAPAISSDGTIYVHVNGGGGNQVAVEQLVALNPDGTHKWTFEFNDGAGSFTSSRQSSPAVAPDGTIWVGSMNTFLHALNPDGTLRCAVSPSVSSMTASPAIASDGTVYITDTMNLTAVDPADCGIVWSRSFGISGHAGSPSIGDDGTIYIAGSEHVDGTTSDHLFAFNPDGTIRWRFPLGRGSDSTPAIGGDGTIYVAADGLYAVNPDGSLAWHEGCWSSSSSSNSAPIVGADGTIYWMQAFRHCAHAADGTLKWKSSVDSAPPTLQYSGTIGSDSALYFPEGPGPGGDTVVLRVYATPSAPPTNPTLSSPSHQVRTWSTDTTVDVTWSGASDEDGSVDGYSYVWDTVPGTNPDTVKDAEAPAAGTTSPPLEDGDSHYFHLRTVDDEGLWSDAVHLGPFWVEADAKGEAASVDLVADGVNLRPSEPTEGDRVEFSTQYRNDGNTQTGAFDVRVEVDGEVLEVSRNDVGLNAGASTNHAGFFWTATPGTHVVRAILDPGDEVAESDEGNNVVETSFTVQRGLGGRERPACEGAPNTEWTGHAGLLVRIETRNVEDGWAVLRASRSGSVVSCQAFPLPEEGTVASQVHVQASGEYELNLNASGGRIPGTGVSNWTRDATMTVDAGRCPAGTRLVVTWPMDPTPQSPYHYAPPDPSTTSCEPRPCDAPQEPVFNEVSPRDGAPVSNVRPTITASYDIGGDEVAFEQGRFELDGVERDAGFASDSVRFTPDFDLAYGAHTVTVTISNCNETTSKSWTFTIQQRPESGEKTDDEQAREHRREPGRGGSSSARPSPSAGTSAGVGAGARLSLNDADGGEWRIAGAEHGARVNGTLTLSLESSDGREATSVEWRIDGQLEARRSSAPYWFVVDTQGDADGEHIIEAEIHEQNEENGDEVSASVEITLVFENGSHEAAVPGPGVGLMALAMVAAVLLKTDRPRKGRPRPSDCNSI